LQQLGTRHNLIRKEDLIGTFVSPSVPHEELWSAQVSTEIHPSGRVLVCHHLEIVAFGLSSLLQADGSFTHISSATTIGGIVKSLEEGVDVIVVGTPGLLLFEFASNEAFQRSKSVSIPKIVFLTSQVDDGLMKEALAQGIDAVIDARLTAQDIIRKISLVSSSAKKATGVQAFQHWKLKETRTILNDICRDETDMQIIALITRGFSNDEISGEIFIALQTVRNRISRLLSAAAVKNRTQLAIMFSREGEFSSTESGF
jgi:NarL family two-component system response regulator LiaR